jgi:16S rRNA (adenine1518-N6/adenine1519-N6)-dimethyltransferase
VSTLLNGQVKSLLRDLDIKAKKSLGQHFLIDRSVLQQIISAADIGPGDIVIEVGSGLGVLTVELAKRASRVIAVEVDAKLASALLQRLTSLHNVNVVNADILQTTPATLLRNAEVISAPHYKVVANLPYYVASPVLRHFLESPVQPSQMVVMVQKEVGEAIAAMSGKMSLLAVSVQFYGKPVIVAHVSSRSFYPPPKVDSTILRIDLYEQPEVEVADVDGFFAVVRAGFSAPRKQLRNSLAQGLGISTLETMTLLEGAGINPQRRAETLSVQEWAEIYEVVSHHDYAVRG